MWVMGQKGKTLVVFRQGYRGIVRKALGSVSGRFHHSLYLHPRKSKLEYFNHLSLNNELKAYRLRDERT